MDPAPAALVLALLPSLAAGGDDPARRELRVFDLEKGVLKSYGSAPRELREEIFKSINRRIKSIGAEVDLADSNLDLYRSYKDLVDSLSLPEIPKIVDEFKEIRILLKQMSSEDVADGLVADDEHLRAALNQLLTILKGDKLEDATWNKVREKLKDWLDSWTTDAADPRDLKAKLSLLSDFSRVAGGGMDPILEGVAGFAGRLAKASSESNPSTAAMANFNGCFEAIRNSPLMKSKGDDLEKLARKHFCSIPLSTEKGMDWGPLTPERAESLSRLGARTAGRAELVRVQQFLPPARTAAAPATPPGPPIEVAGITSGKIYLLPQKVLRMEYRLLPKDDGGGDAKGWILGMLLLDRYQLKKAGDLLTPPLPSSLLSGHVFVYIESLNRRPAQLVDDASWTRKKVLDRLGDYLASRSDKEDAAQKIIAFLGASNISAPIPEARTMADTKDLAGLFVFPDPKAAQETFLLKRSILKMAGAIEPLMKGGVLSEVEELPDKAVAEKLFEDPWKDLLGFNRAGAACLLDSSYAFTPPLADDDEKAVCGICAVIPLWKKVR